MEAAGQAVRPIEEQGPGTARGETNIGGPSMTGAQRRSASRRATPELRAVMRGPGARLSQRVSGGGAERSRREASRPAFGGRVAPVFAARCGSARGRCRPKRNEVEESEKLASQAPWGAISDASWRGDLARRGERSHSDARCHSRDNKTVQYALPSRRRQPRHTSKRRQSRHRPWPKLPSCPKRPASRRPPN